MFSLTSEKVSNAEKSEIASAVLKTPKTELQRGAPVMDPLTPTTMLALRITDQSRYLFEALNIGKNRIIIISFTHTNTNKHEHTLFLLFLRP